MRTEERKETKTIEVVNKIYIADDGTEFTDEEECAKYEAKKEKERLFEELKPYLIKYGDIPINTDALYSDLSEYRYYKVPNKSVLDIIARYYDGEVCTRDDASFPTIVCIEETLDYCNGYGGDVYEYYLDQMMNVTKNFFNNIGVDVEFRNAETRENLLMETAMRMQEVFDDMCYAHHVNPDKVDGYGTIERLQLFREWAREFEKTYAGTDEYENDFISLSDEFATKKLREVFE